VGNIVLKTLESFATGMFDCSKGADEQSETNVGSHPRQKRSAHDKRKIDPDNYGGAPLLGLNGHVMKAHGSARERSIMNAIRVATESVQHQINQMIRDELAQANKVLPQDIMPEPELLKA